MNLLFAHDHIFYKYKSKYYSNGGLSAAHIERYTNIFKNLTIISRQKEDIVNDKFTLASTNNTEFVKVPNFKSLKNYYKKNYAKKIIEEEVKKADCIVARLPSSIGKLSIKFAKKHKKPYLVEVVGCSFDGLWNHSLKGKILSLPDYRSMKKLVLDAPYVVYVTNSYLQNKYPTTGQHTNCSNVSLRKYDDKILDERLNKIENISKNNKIIIGTTGAINIKYKGQEYVIKALAKLKEQGITKFEYHLVGGGDSRYLYNIAKKYNVSEQVKFLGGKPHNEVIQWLDTIDIYIQPSLTEGLPRALIEAMSRGLPSIGSDVGGIPELLSKEVIFKKKSTIELFNILSAIDKEFMKNESNKNFEKSKEYNKEAIEERRNRFLREFKENI